MEIGNRPAKILNPQGLKRNCCPEQPSIAPVRSLITILVFFFFCMFVSMVFGRLISIVYQRPSSKSGTLTAPLFPEAHCRSEGIHVETTAKVATPIVQTVSRLVVVLHRPHALSSRGDPGLLEGKSRKARQEGIQTATVARNLLAW